MKAAITDVCDRCRHITARRAFSRYDMSVSVGRVALRAGGAKTAFSCKHGEEEGPPFSHLLTVLQLPREILDSGGAADGGATHQ